MLMLLYDPQTSGGLLVAVDPSLVETAVEALRRAGVLVARVGKATAPEGPLLRVS